MKSIEIEAKTPEEAIEIALKELDVERSDIAIDVVSKGKSGLLGIGGEPARVRATVLESPNDLVKTGSDVLNKLLSKMGVSAVVNLKNAHLEDVGGPMFDIDGVDSGLLIGRRGETLRAIQLIATMLVSSILGERVNMLIDISGYQERRYQTLRNLAQKVANRVLSTGGPIALEPMRANERRVIHMELSDYDGISTTSIGKGLERHVVVGSNDAVGDEVS